MQKNILAKVISPETMYWNVLRHQLNGDGLMEAEVYEFPPRGPKWARSDELRPYSVK